MEKSTTLSGYFKFGFENRNLFPSENWREHWDRGECLPIGIDADNASLLAKARELDGHEVIVSGTIGRLVRGGELNASFCKNVGLVVEAIQPR